MTIRGASDTSPPTDLELMLYHDGELGEARLVAVQAWLERQPEGAGARNTLMALGLVSDLIRARSDEALAGDEGGLGASGAFDVADAVMERIAAEPVLATPAPESAPRPALGAAPRAAANDNARSFYVIASAVVAAAAAVLLWARVPAPAHHSEVAQVTAARSGGAATAEPGIDHGVEVAAVNFGARMGAVFYVPDGNSESSTTTVVWLSDDSAGENQ